MTQPAEPHCLKVSVSLQQCEATSTRSPATVAIGSPPQFSNKLINLTLITQDGVEDKDGATNNFLSRFAWGWHRGGSNVVLFVFLLDYFSSFGGFQAFSEDLGFCSKKRGYGDLFLYIFLPFRAPPLHAPSSPCAIAVKPQPPWSDVTRGGFSLSSHSPPKAAPEPPPFLPCSPFSLICVLLNAKVFDPIGQIQTNPFFLSSWFGLDLKRKSHEFDPSQFGPFWSVRITDLAKSSPNRPMNTPSGKCLAKLELSQYVILGSVGITHLF